MRLLKYFIEKANEYNLKVPKAMLELLVDAEDDMDKKSKNKYKRTN